jgi:hypothetical protein
MYSDNLLYKAEVHEIIGAAMAVHRYFGCGFTEKVYQDALEIELTNSNIPFHAKVSGCDIALLINFGEISLKFERFLVKK